MRELKEKMKIAIASSASNAEAAEKCATIAKEYTLKKMDEMSYFKDKDGDRVYLNIIKTRMAVQLEEI